MAETAQQTQHWVAQFASTSFSEELVGLGKSRGATNTHTRMRMGFTSSKYVLPSRSVGNMWCTTTSHFTSICGPGSQNFLQVHLPGKPHTPTKPSRHGYNRSFRQCSKKLAVFVRIVLRVLGGQLSARCQKVTHYIFV